MGGQGAGYSYNVTQSNGTSITVKDTHWITGGGGGRKSS